MNDTVRWNAKPSMVDRGRQTARRLLAGLTALLAWAAFYKHVREAVAALGIVHGLWFMANLYSHWLNTLTAIVFTVLAISSRDVFRPTFLSKFLILIGILWAMILITPGWAGFLASSLKLRIEHGLVPALVVVYWLLFVPRGRLRARDPLLWTIMPIVYTTYALTRGALTGAYPYIVADVRIYGYRRILLEVLLITLGSVAMGYAVLWFDHMMHRLQRRLRALAARHHASDRGHEWIVRSGTEAIPTCLRGPGLTASADTRPYERSTGLPITPQ